MSKEYEVVQKQAIKTISIYLLVVILAGFAIVSLVQGILLQLNGFAGNATLLYMTGLGSLMAAVGIFSKGRQIINSGI
ncbi:MAG: hypothetical protein QXU92_01335 [Candidatus Diapherotrites archaeon]